MTLGLAIPATKSYMDSLEKLLYNISMQTILPDEVSISISEVDDYKPNKDYGLNLIITTHKEPKNGAENRNIASDKLSTDIISFIDCDDLMHPQRIEYIKKSFEYGIDAVVHEFEISHNCEWKTPEYSLDDFLKLKHQNLNFEKNVIDSVVPESLFPNNLNKKYVYHNAHLSIKNEINKKFKYETNHVFPDSLYNRTLVENGYKISFISNKLSYYDLKW
jgi:hypothetical protein